MLEPTWTALKNHRRLHQIVATLVRFGAQDVLLRLGLGVRKLRSGYAQKGQRWPLLGCKK